MTFKEYFTKVDEYPICMWDTFTPFIKTIVSIGFALFIIFAVFVGITL